MDRVFVSYRRDDTGREARLLKEHLELHLDDVAVFIDSDDIAAGAQWPDVLRQEVARSSAVIALVGPAWRGPAQVDRLDDPDDWVRRELVLALDAEQGKILPVVVEGAGAVLDGLPADLEPLSTLQRLPLSHQRWQDEIRAIAIWVARVVGADTKPTGEMFPKPSPRKTAYSPMGPAEIEKNTHTDDLAGWTTRSTVVRGEAPDGIELYKVFEFSNFRRAMTFMCRVATKAEELNHHPEWRNVWNRVFVSQRTWDAGHVLTLLDFEAAARMNEVAAEVAALKSVPWPPR
jgi:pterin-4a-carbinolamine dehydratase